MPQIPPPALLIVLTLMAPAPAARAQDWPARKCTIFAEAWASSAPADGPAAPSQAFRRGIEGFIASGCATPRDTCPATAADIAILDALALIVATEGMATTFLPIACPAPATAP